MRVLLCPLSSGGFLYPATAAALELHRRGHDVTLFAAGAAGRAAAAAGIAVLPSVTEREPYAFDVSRWFRDGESQYRVVRDAARALRPDAVVTSVLCPGALLAAEVLDLPVVVLGLTCHLWPYTEPAEHGETAGPDAADRRSVRIHTAGVSRLTDVYARTDEELVGLISDWSDEQVSMLVGFLDAASDVASRLADDLTTRASARPRP